MSVAAHTAADYLWQLQALLPPGGAWPRDPEAALTQTLTPIANELARIDASAVDLLIEADPRQTTQLLSEWETECGLPDCCAGPAVGLTARRAAVVTRLTARGGQSIAYFIAVAATLGFTVTITEFNPYTCEMDCEEPVCDEGWRFTWRVNAASSPIGEATCESDTETPLRWWGNATLQCAIKSRAPAHTNVLFGYGGY
jgi:uncharacterized protein YmfQ (DUF2313 family)